MQSSQVSNEVLLQLVSRLETAISKLESTPKVPSLPPVPKNLNNSFLTTEKMAVFSDYWNKTLKLLVELQNVAKETAVDQIISITDLILQALCGHQDILLASQNFKKPVNNDLKILSKKFCTFHSKVDEIGFNNKDYSLHSDAVKNGLNALNWFFADSGCADITQTYLESIGFAGNKIYMKKIPAQTKWVKAFIAIINEVNTLVKENYKCGLIWANKGDIDVSNLILNIGNTYRINFKISEEAVKANDGDDDPRKQIEKAITSGSLRGQLKPIGQVVPLKKEETKPVVTAKEENKPVVAVKEEIKPVIDNNVTISNFTSKFHDTKKGRRVTLIKKGKKEIFDEISCNFNYENIEGEIKELDPEKLSHRTILQITNSSGCVFKVNKKIKTIRLSNCEDITIVCNSLISTFEIVNCYKVRVQVLEGTVNSFSIDGSTNVVIHLNLESAGSEISASLSSEVKLRLPKENDKDDYTEHVIPQAFVFTLNTKREVETKVSDIYQKSY